jgi:ATP-dependent exoDNAse (exonuclease V) alpha subunit
MNQNICLTEEQQEVIDGLLQFENKVQKLGGYAGTGKTTVISYLHEILPTYAICAFTGKAANVLRQKGMPASTIHSLIYKPILDSLGNIILDEHGSPIFRLADFLGNDGIIVDEASMVSKTIYQDLCSFGLPIIFVGDHGQLEPVGEGMKLMMDPDFRLEKIHRNAGEIAHFAEHIRMGNPANSFQSTEGKVVFIKNYELNNYIDDVDQIICAFNKTRVAINRKVRYRKEFDSNWPVEGDKIMCLKNHKKIGVFNGMQGHITSLSGKFKNRIEFTSNEMVYSVFFDPEQFHKEKCNFQGGQDDPLPFDYGYCITAHKSQGDEWNNVMVIEQRCQMWDHTRWAYTAASRAKERVIWVS